MGVDQGQTTKGQEKKVMFKKTKYYKFKIAILINCKYS